MGIHYPNIQPGGVINTASSAPQFAPNGNIAQGSLFTVYLVPQLPVPNLLINSYPVQTQLNGFSMNVTIGGITTRVLIFGCASYPGGTIVDGIMPSTTPVGTGTITVIYNGATGAAAPVTVVANSFAWFTHNAAGSGPGAFTDVNGADIYPLHSAHNGDIVIGYGTGLGSAPSNNANGGHVVIHPPNFKLSVGSVQIPPDQIDFVGPASSAAEDQLNFRIPGNIFGCQIPVVVQIGDIVSNSALISIGSGDICYDGSTSLQGYTQSELLLAKSKGAFSVGMFLLIRDYGQGDRVDASFNRISQTQLFLGGDLDWPTWGNCSVSTTGGHDSSRTPLDAGATAMTITGPSGTFPIPPISPGLPGRYGAQLDSTSSFFNIDGTFRVTSTGGPDVGVFNITARPGFSPLFFAERVPTKINRSQGLTLDWRELSSSNIAVIRGDVRQNSGNGHIGFTCLALGGVGGFTVPASTLLAMPPTSSSLSGTLTVLFTNGAYLFLTGPQLDSGSLAFALRQQFAVTYE